MTGWMASMEIVATNLRKVFLQKRHQEPLVAIDHLSFRVEPGEVVSIVGRTGCGKSTFFNILLGLEHPTSGSLRIGDKTPYGDFAFFRGKIGCIFQNDRLLPWRTALDNAGLGLEILGFSRSEQQRMASDWLERLGLERFMQAYPSELSGGMRQRVAMARAFACNPRVLLADEAFGHLDEVTAMALRDEFLKLVRLAGHTAILITHHLDEALDISDRVLVFGSPACLLADLWPAHAEDKKSVKEEIQMLIREGSGAS